MAERPIIVWRTHSTGSLRLFPTGRKVDSIRLMFKQVDCGQNDSVSRNLLEDRRLKLFSNGRTRKLKVVSENLWKPEALMILIILMIINEIKVIIKIVIG